MEGEEIDTTSPVEGASATSSSSSASTLAAASDGGTNTNSSGSIQHADDETRASNITAAATKPPPAKLHKCSIRGCKFGNNPNEPTQTCDATNCDRKIHYQCFEHIIKRKNKEKIEELGLDEEHMEGKGFCTLACFKRYASSVEAGERWHNDGKRGKGDQNCSENLLVRLFLSNNVQYGRFRDPVPLKKTDICQLWADKINSYGVQVERTAHQVQCHVEAIEKQMRAAIDFADSETGVGLQETDPDSWDRAILLKCKFYHQLKPVFIERAGMTPSATTNDILDGSSSSDSDSSDSNSSDSDNSDGEAEFSDNGDDDYDSDDGRQQKKKKQQKKPTIDLTKTGEDSSSSDDDNDEQLQQLSGDSKVSSSTKKKPTKQQRRKKTVKKRSSKGKTKKNTAKTPRKKQSGKQSGETTDDLLRQLLVMRAKEMEDRKRRREERKEREAAKRKRVKSGDYDLSNYDQFIELGEKFNKICAVYGGDRVRAAMQFPEFAETTLLTDEEKNKLHDMQQLQHLV